MEKTINEIIDNASEADLRFVIKALIAANRVYEPTVREVFKCADMIVPE
jgi:hypothetical protein